MNRMFTLRALCAATLSLGLAACGGGGDAAADAPPSVGAPSPNTTPPAPPPPAAGSFTIDLSIDKAVILQGDSVTVKATIQRSNGFSEAVQLALTDLPSGVSATAATISAGGTDADIVLTASAA